MKLSDTFKMSLAGLSTHKSRSVLTVLGIVIGITSVILVMSLGQSAQNLILGEINSLGPNNIFVIPGRQPEGGGDFGLSTILTDSLKERDLQDLRKKSNVPGAVKVSPIVIGPAIAAFGSEAYNTTVLGGDEGIIKLYDLAAAEGEFFTNEDVSQKSDVAVIGKKIQEKLFGSSRVIGEKIKIKEKNFRVIGILETKGQTPFVNFDEVVIMPYTTVQQDVLGIKFIHRLAIETESVEAIPAVKKDVETLLRNNHNITDPDKDDFFIQTQADLVKTIGNITGVLTAFLGSVAAISLVVGGIGIMNIMFVSVTERTREIGLRKALGATNKNVLIQFLTEAVMLTLSGGIIGIILGLALSFAASYIITNFFSINFPFAFSYSGVILGVLVSTLVGLIFGIFPARKASQKSPIEALRYE